MRRTWRRAARRVQFKADGLPVVDERVKRRHDGCLRALEGAVVCERSEGSIGVCGLCQL